MDGGDTFGNHFFKARSWFFENTGGSFPHWILREDHAKEFKKELFKNATRLLKTECLQLPPKIFTERYVNLSGTQREIYHKVSKELLKVLTLPEGKVKIQNSLVKMAKLSQLSSGFVYTDKKPQLFSPNPKLELLKEVIEEIPKDDKIVIYVRWLQDLESIKAMLDSMGLRCAILSGSTKNRQTPIQSFLGEATQKILLSQMTAGAYGLTLTVSHTIIYYSLGFSSIEFQQSQDRIHRIGQKFPCVYVSLMCNNTIDKYIYDSLKENVDIAESLLNGKSVERLKENLKLLGGASET
jgi:SNF2 family DNA or RNA helicase